MNATELDLLEVITCTPGKLIPINLTCKSGKLVQTAVRCDLDGTNIGVRVLESDPCFENSSSNMDTSLLWLCYSGFFLVGVVAFCCLWLRERRVEQRRMEERKADEENGRAEEFQYGWGHHPSSSGSDSDSEEESEEDEKGEEGEKSKQVIALRKAFIASRARLASVCSRPDKSSAEHRDGHGYNPWNVWVQHKGQENLNKDIEESLLAASRMPSDLDLSCTKRETEENGSR